MVFIVFFSGFELGFPVIEQLSLTCHGCFPGAAAYPFTILQVGSRILSQNFGTRISAVGIPHFFDSIRLTAKKSNL